MLLFFLNLCMHLKCEKSVAYIQDVFLIKKSRFLVCLKTRRATKRDVLVLATLRYLFSYQCSNQNDLGKLLQKLKKMLLEDATCIANLGPIFI